MGPITGEVGQSLFYIISFNPYSTIIIIILNYRGGNRFQGPSGCLSQVHPAEGQMLGTRTELRYLGQGDPVHPCGAPLGTGS